METKLLRHYIFINPAQILDNINDIDNKTFNEIKKIHEKNYNNGEIIKYYGYNDIVTLLNNYDKELCELFLQLNYNYPALLADIGRLIILYTYGGIYHDLSFVSNIQMINYLNSVSDEIEIIGEQHPTQSNRVRNSNIIALHKNSQFLNSVLQQIKIKLIDSKEAFGPAQMFSIGSGIYINEFLNNQNTCIYKYSFKKLIFKYVQIRLNTPTRWQKTYEYIFKI